MYDCMTWLINDVAVFVFFCQLSHRALGSIKYQNVLRHSYVFYFICRQIASYNNEGFDTSLPFSPRSSTN